MNGEDCVVRPLEFNSFGIQVPILSVNFKSTLRIDIVQTRDDKMTYLWAYLHCGTVILRSQ